MGACGRGLTKADLKRIETEGHIPAMITSVGGGKHVMPVRSGSPIKSGHIQLFDPMIKKPTFKRYEEVFNGHPFKSGNMKHTSHGLYGIAPERSSVKSRSSSMESLDSTDEGLTRSTAKALTPSKGKRKGPSAKGARKK